MKRIRLVMLILVLLLSVNHALADYKASDAYNVAKRVITQAMEEEGCSDFRFAILDYKVQQEGDLYAVYADAKYVDKAGRRQRSWACCGLTHHEIQLNKDKTHCQPKTVGFRI